MFKIPPIAHYGLDHIELIKLDEDGETDHSSTVTPSTQTIITSSKAATTNSTSLSNQNSTTSLTTNGLTNTNSVTSKPPNQTTITTHSTTNTSTTSTSTKKQEVEEETNLKKTVDSLRITVIVSFALLGVLVLSICALFFQYFRIRKKINEQARSNNSNRERSNSNSNELNNSNPMTTQF